ncbi:MAG: hypothetical protein ACTS5I_13400, partial [Rhodanobacter sp.]
MLHFLTCAHCIHETFDPQFAEDGQVAPRVPVFETPQAPAIALDFLPDVAVALRRHERFQARAAHRQQLGEQLPFHFIDPLPPLNGPLD